MRIHSYFKIVLCNQITIINPKITKIKEKVGLDMEEVDLLFKEQAHQSYKAIKTFKDFKE